MSSNKEKQIPGQAEITREQLNLLKTEKEIKEALEKISEQYNQLLIEELQINAAIFAQKQKARKAIQLTKTEDPLATTVTNLNDQFDAVERINEQHLNLESAHGQEEYDD